MNVDRMLSDFMGSCRDFFQSFKNKNDIDTYKRIRDITFPAFIELFFTSLFGVVDLAMVGFMATGTSAIVGVGLTNQPFALLIAIFSAVNVGTTTLVSWNIGEGNKKKASLITRQAILFNLVLGVLLSAVGIFGAKYLMRFMSTDPLVIEYSTVFLEILCYGLVFQAVNMCITAALRGCGETKVPMIYNVLANFVNIALNYLLIYGKFGFPEMGVAGAAIATTSSRIAACIAAICCVLFWKRSPIRIKLRDNWVPDFKILKDIFIIGMPAAGEQFVIQSGLLIYSRIVSSLGTNAYAAHQIAANVNSMAFSISQAFSVSNTSLVGRAVGGGDYDMAEKFTVLSRRLARLVTGGVAIIFIIFAPYFCMIYTRDSVVIDIAVPIFYFMALIQFVQSSQMSTAGALRGSGDTMYPFYASIVGIWGLRIALASLFVFVFHWGVIGAWFAFFIDQCGRSYVIKHRFSSGRWREMKAIKEAEMQKQAEKLKVQS